MYLRCLLLSFRAKKSIHNNWLNNIIHQFWTYYILRRRQLGAFCKIGHLLCGYLLMYFYLANSTAIAIASALIVYVIQTCNLVRKVLLIYMWISYWYQYYDTNICIYWLLYFYASYTKSIFNFNEQQILCKFAIFRKLPVSNLQIKQWIICRKFIKISVFEKHYSIHKYKKIQFLCCLNKKKCNFYKLLFELCS